MGRRTKIKCKADGCRKEYTRRADMEEHYYVHHEGKTFGCNLCNSSFKSKKGLRNHAVTHQNQADQSNIHGPEDPPPPSDSNVTPAVSREAPISSRTRKRTKWFHSHMTSWALSARDRRLTINNGPFQGHQYIYFIRNVRKLAAFQAKNITAKLQQYVRYLLKSNQYAFFFRCLKLFAILLLNWSNIQAHSCTF